MTILSVMKEQALAEFDAMVAQREREIRSTMMAAGASQFEIDTYIEGCRPGLAEQRAGIPRMVTIALMKAGVPLEHGVNDNVCS